MTPVANVNPPGIKIARYDRVGSNHGAFPNGDPRENDGVRPNDARESADRNWRAPRVSVLGGNR